MRPQGLRHAFGTGGRSLTGVMRQTKPKQCRAYTRHSGLLAEARNDGIGKSGYSRGRIAGPENAWNARSKRK
jgi:hypothetical protein